MHFENLAAWQHDHNYGLSFSKRNETRTRWVIALTLFMMVVEICAGTVFGSMALLADGWHMGTHAAALAVAAFAYWYARRHANDPRYSFGTGKVGALGGFGSAIGLAVVALYVMFESIYRLTSPVAILFDQAIAVAGIGLVVNLASALILREEHHHHIGDTHDTLHHHHDHNLRGAYLHVLADAMTSVLALIALSAGKYLGWQWMDPCMGIVGAIVIGRWSYNLLRDTSGVLLDAEIQQQRYNAIKESIESQTNDRVSDLHVWRVGPQQLAAIVSVVSEAPCEPEYYKQLLSHFTDLAHLTVEVNCCGTRAKTLSTQNIAHAEQ